MQFIKQIIIYKTFYLKLKNEIISWDIIKIKNIF